jgi:hypothetical protein
MIISAGDSLVVASEVPPRGLEPGLRSVYSYFFVPCKMSSTTTTSYLFGQKRERKRKGKQTRLAQVVDQKLGYMLWTKNWDICWAQVGLGPIRPDSSWARISFFFSSFFFFVFFD